MAQTPRLIDGIVLTKFDTIDDKVNMDGTGQHEMGRGILLSGGRAPRLPVTEGMERSGSELIGYPLSPLQVGAAISMTYITSKPIVFVGTGQTYCDLRSLNAKAVVAALMKA